MTPESSAPLARIQLTPGSLWPRVLTQAREALANGALQSIATSAQILERDRIPFVVRILANVTAKIQAKAVKPVNFNPFLPYDPDLFVADLSDRHICLLNKFNVAPHHLLLVTRDFSPQEQWLNQDDFLALWVCWQEVDGLAFYNGGQLAGASQRHKHVQVMPLPLTPAGASVPIAVTWPMAEWVAGIGSIPVLPFHHAIAPIAWSTFTDGPTAAVSLEQTYRALLQAVGITQPAPDFTARPAYNWLATRDWMMIVPRSQESYHGIPVNALGFAGTFFVRDQAQLAVLQHHGPLAILQAVGQPR